MAAVTITPAFLKKHSGQFDLEGIYRLLLKGKGTCRRQIQPARRLRESGRSLRGFGAFSCAPSERAPAIAPCPPARSQGRLVHPLALPKRHRARSGRERGQLHGGLCQLGASDQGRPRAAGFTRRAVAACLTARVNGPGPAAQSVGQLPGQGGRHGEPAGARGGPSGGQQHCVDKAYVERRPCPRSSSPLTCLRRPAEIEALKQCPKLRVLYLQSFDGRKTNPCCSAPGYRKEMLKV